MKDVKRKRLTCTDRCYWRWERIGGCEETDLFIVSKYDTNLIQNRPLSLFCLEPGLKIAEGSSAFSL